MNPFPLAITAVGMCTSVGRSTVPACAAIRAGVTRIKLLREVIALDGDTQEPVAMRGHSIGHVTEGFVKIGRWLRLGSEALADLARNGKAADLSTQTALLVATRKLDEEFLDGCDIEPIAPADASQALDRRLFEPLCREAGLSIPQGSRGLHARGSVATAAALVQAVQVLQERRCRRVIILAVDSWIDPTALAQAASSNRLRNFDRPTGFQPGEAAVAFCVEPVPASRASRTIAIERVEVAARSDDPLLAPEASAPSVAKACEVALASGSVGDVFVDLTGEDWRARQWGTALVRLAPRIGNARTVLPAVSLGDVGAASGAVGVALAAQAFERNWARAERILVVSTADSGEASAITVGRA